MRFFLLLIFIVTLYSFHTLRRDRFTTQSSSHVFSSPQPQSLLKDSQSLQSLNFDIQTFKSNLYNQLQHLLPSSWSTAVFTPSPSASSSSSSASFFHSSSASSSSQPLINHALDQLNQKIRSLPDQEVKKIKKQFCQDVINEELQERGLQP